MPTVSAFHVQLRGAPREEWNAPRLVYTVDETTAIHRVLRFDEKLKVKPAGMVKAGCARAFAVAPFKVAHVGGRSDWFLHAVDGKAARTKVLSAFRSTRPTLIAVEVDELEMLFRFQPAELMRLVGLVWENRDPLKPVERLRQRKYHSRIRLRSCEMYQRVPGVFRKFWVGTSGPVREEHRLQAIYAIRLAMEVPEFGPRGVGEPGKVLWGRSGRSPHMGNVSLGLRTRCSHLGLGRVNPFTAAQRDALARVALEYGYDPGAMKDWELLRLWTDGAHE